MLFVQEGLNHDRGVYARCFEELFDLANSDSTSTSRFSFSVSVFEIYNEQVLLIVSAYVWLSFSMPRWFIMESKTSNSETFTFQIRDLLSETQSNLPKINMGSHESIIELGQEKADNPLEFLRVLKSAFQNRGIDKSKFNVTHLYVLFCA